MIERLRVRGYKSIADATLHLAPVNLIVGPSCGGKTNLLEALVLLGAAASGDLRRGPYGRGLRGDGPHATALRCRSGEPIQIEAASGGVAYRVHLDEGRGLRYRSELVEVDGAAVASRGQDRCWVALNGRTTYLDTWPDSGIVPAVYCIDRSARAARFLHAIEPTLIVDRPLPEVVDVQALALASAEVSRLVPAVEAGVKVDAFAFFRRLLLRDRFLRHGWSTPENMGDGTLWLLGLFWLLISPEAPPVVALDGAHVALSPDMAIAAGSRICDLAVQGDRQLFWVTTRAHARATFGDDPRARVFHLERDWRGVTVVEEEGASHVP